MLQYDLPRSVAQHLDIGSLRLCKYYITLTQKNYSLTFLRVGSFFQRLDTAPWTPYLEECCTMIYQSGYHRDDKYAVALIKMQLVSEKIHHNAWHGSSMGRPHVAPPVLYLKSLETEIKSLRVELSAEIENNREQNFTFPSRSNAKLPPRLLALTLSQSRGITLQDRPCTIGVYFSIYHPRLQPLGISLRMLGSSASFL